MSGIVLILTLATIYFPYQSAGSWNLNRTIGWRYDIYNGWITLSPIILFLLGYAIIYLIRRNTNVYLSGIHVFIIIIHLFLLKFTTNYDVIDLVCLLSWGIFILNLIQLKKRELNALELEGNILS